MAILVGGSVVHGDHNDAARGRQGHVDVRPPPLLLLPLPLLQLCTWYNPFR
jgi:hypothetical protein